MGQKCYSEFLIDVIRLELGKLFNLIQINMVFQKQLFINVLQKRCSQKLHRNHMAAPKICNSNKRRLKCRCFPANFAKFLKITFLQNTSGRLLLDFFIHLTKLFFAIQWTNRNQVLYIFEHVLSWLLNVMNIMSFASGKLYFAKQTPHRSSHLHIFSKIGILKNVTNFTQKHLCWSCFLIKLQALHKSNTHVFLWNLWSF